MTENADMKLDDMDLQLLNLMGSFQIFNQAEIKEIERNWTEHLCCLVKDTKVKEDFMAYIKYDLDLLAKIKERREVMNFHEKKGVIDFALITKINTFYNCAVLTQFPSDMQLWNSYFEFCRKLHLHSAGSGALHEMTRIHGNKEEIWLFAANWEKQGKNPDKARSWLMGGIREHKTSSVLHFEYIKTELDIANEYFLCQRLARKRKQETDEDNANKESKKTLRGKCAEMAYQYAAKTITDFKFYEDMFKLTENYPAASNLRDMIFNDIQTKFLTTEAAWEIRARLHMEEADKDELPVATVIDVETNSEIKGVAMEERISKCVDVYEEAVKRIPTMAMWTYYLNFLYDINQDDPSEPARLLYWETGFQAALDKKMVSDKHYLHYIEHLKLHSGMDNAQMLDLLNKATKTYPACAQLWFEIVRYHLAEGSTTEGMTLFRNANNCLQDNPAMEVMKLWNLMIMYMGTTTRPQLENLYQVGIQIRSDLGQLIKPIYLEWKIMMGGISEGRKLLDLPFVVTPPCLPFYQQLIKAESILPNPCLESIRNYFETCAEHFGSTEVSVWLDYIKFENTLGDVTFVAQVHQRAVNALTGDMLEEFLQKYSNQKIQSLNQAGNNVPLVLLD